MRHSCQSMTQPATVTELLVRHTDEGVRLAGQRRTRASACRARVRARAFWRGVRCAYGPPGLDGIAGPYWRETCTTHGAGEAADDDDQYDVGSGPMEGDAGAVAEKARQTTETDKVESQQGAVTARGMSMDEFLLVAAEIKKHRPHIRSEWSGAATSGKQREEDQITPRLALTDSCGHREEEAAERLAMATGMAQDLHEGPLCIGELVTCVLTRLEHIISDEETVLKKCAQAEAVLRQLLAHDVVQTQPGAVLEDARSLVEKSSWCCDLEEQDEKAMQELLKHCVACCDASCGIVLEAQQLRSIHHGLEPIQEEGASESAD